MRLEDLPNYCYGEPYDWDIQDKRQGLWIDPRLLKGITTTRESMDLALKEVMIKLEALPKASLTREELLERLRGRKEERRSKSNT